MFRRTLTATLTAVVLVACSPPEGPEPAAPSTTTGSTTAATGSADVGNEWAIRATEPVDTTDTIVEAGNQPPETGHRYMLTEIEFKLTELVDGQTASPADGWVIEYETPTRFYTGTGQPLSCGWLDGLIDMNADLKQGGSETGVWCIPVPAGDLEELTVVVNNGGRRDPVQIWTK